MANLERDAVQAPTQSSSSSWAAQRSAKVANFGASHHGSSTVAQNARQSSSSRQAMATQSSSPAAG